MSKFLKYNTTKYTISQIQFDRNLTAKTESIMALGNGYLGIRSVDEEVETFNKEDLFVNGVFNKADDQMVSELANLADSIQTTIMLDGEIFAIDSQDKYIKTINLKTGVLTRKIQAKRNNKEYELNFKRMVSQEIKNIFIQKIEIKQISGDQTEIIISPTINGQTTNKGAQHFKEGEKRRKNLQSIRYIEETNESNIYVFHNMVTRAFLGQVQLLGGNDDYIVSMDRRQVGFKIKTRISKDKPIFTLEKLMSVNTAIDHDEKRLSFKEVEIKSDKLMCILQTETFDSLEAKSIKSFAEYQSKFFVEIKGNNENAKYANLALAFSVFHMNSFVPKENTNLSIGAKGLSGEGYQGHSFWDTEFFIVPNYLYTQPKIARNLLVYRYKGIQGARAKAMETKEREEESKLIGAQYPWEMAWPTSGEVCPYWGQADIVTGKQVPIASRRQEIHVSADIAFAVDQYFDFTNDVKFMEKMGYEMIIDTAIFWAHRAEKQTDDSYMIKDVMGPNEYKGNIDNNAYINAFAKKNIELAFKYMDKLNSSSEGKIILEEVKTKIPYKIPIELMKDVMLKLVQQKPNGDGIIAENDQFLALDRVDVRSFQMLGDAGKKLFNTQEGHKRLSSQLVKQADVTLLTFLLPKQYNKDVIKSNFEFYEPITTHDSSLSPTTYAIQAIDLRKMDLGKKLFDYSIDIDMGTNMKSCDAGIHAGAIAAIWQTTVYGYGGLRWIDGELHINPILPEEWDGMEYEIIYKSIKLIVKVEKNNFFIKTKEKEIEVYIQNIPRMITSQEQRFEVNHG